MNWRWISSITEIARQHENQRKLIERLAEEMRERQTPEFRGFSEELGWLGFLPKSFMYLLYKRYKGKGWNKAWEALEKWLDNKDSLDALRKQLVSSSILNTRIDVIGMGFHSHHEGNYLCSISILLPQVEGLIWDLGVQLKLVDASTPFSTAKLDKNGSPVKDKKGKIVSWKLCDLVSQIWKFPAFETRFRNKVYSSEFRHRIAHGRDISSFTKIKSTETILLVLCVWGKASSLGI